MGLFDLSNKKLIKSCHPILADFFKNHLKDYINLFFYEKDLALAGLNLTPLMKVGILEKIDGKFRARVQVYPLSGRFICTDFFKSRHRTLKHKDFSTIYLTDRDGVWGILDDETPILAKRNITQLGDIVLDLATGSGMIAIFCASKAKKVIGTDINPKAINYATFNAILNSVEDKVEFRLGDLFKPVEGEKFDLIIWNGPTVAVPETKGNKYPIYSDGGQDGAEFTRRFINEAFDFLKPNGKLQWYDCAMGNEKLPVSMDYAKNKWGNKKVKITYKSLTSTPVNLQKSYQIFAKYNLNPKNNFLTPLASKRVTIKEEAHWHKWLAKKGFTSVYYALVEVVPADKFEFDIIFPKKDLRTDRYLTQYWLFMSYPTILKHLQKAEQW